MSFHEKSAWIMSVALAMASVFYLRLVAAASAGLGELAPPILPAIIKFTVAMVILAIVGHVIIAIFAPKEADAPLDEREQQIMTRAGNIAGYVLGAGVITSLGIYLFTYDGHLLFYGVFAGLIVSQLAEYLVQILLYRTSW